MTTALDPQRHDPAQPAPRYRSRTTTELFATQVAAIDAWHAARHDADDRIRATQTSREARMDLARREEVLRREQAALVAHTEAQLRDTRWALALIPAPRAVVAHRSEWYRTTVVAGLRAAGVQAVAELDNGADVVGVVVAEQPDLLFVEDKLQMVGGPATLRRALRFSPRTRAAAQVSSDQGIGEVMDAGACTAFTRRVPPGEVAVALALLLRD